jgi:peptidyl-prolyl cis-trans isomerase SurA
MSLTADQPMTSKLSRITGSALLPAAIMVSMMLPAASAHAQTRPAAAPQSPYGGVTVEDIVARVNDQIITQSDYDRALKELDQEGKQAGASMQELSEKHKDLLRSLIDQQLWLSKGKELSINGETELIKRLDEIRKQYNLETLQDLEKAAKEQGVSFEDFKAGIRNGIITQLVMREEVSRKVQFTPGEVERYFDAHKQEYVKPESIQLSEILVSSGPDADDAAKNAAAKAKADDIEAKLHSGGDFTQLAKTQSDGTTAADGGAMGTYKRGDGNLAKVFEDAVFPLKAGEYSAPIHTRQGYVIFKVDQHVAGGVPAFKDVEQDVEQKYYEQRMEPAMRQYLSQMREEAYIQVKTGFTDTGASAKQVVLTNSVYTPPTSKKKKKVERTRFRETARTFRQKGPQTAEAAPPDAPAPAAKKNVNVASEKPGKKEKIRFGQAPSKTLPSAPSSATEDAGAIPPAETASAAQEPVNPLEANAQPTQKTRFSSRAKDEKKAKSKAKGQQPDDNAIAPPDAAEVADRQQQATALGLNGDTSVKKKKKTTTTNTDKTRLQDRNNKPDGTAAPTEPTASPNDQSTGPASTRVPASAPTPGTEPAPQQ